MPYKSEEQRRYMNAQAGKKVPQKVVDEFNRESKGMTDLKSTSDKKKVNLY